MQDEESIQSQIPSEITQGDVADFKISIPAYAPGDGYLHTFTLIGKSARFASLQGVQVSIPEKISIAIPVSITSTLPPGDLNYQLRVSKDNRTAAVLLGTVYINENLELSENVDTRTNQEKILEAIDQALAGSNRITVLDYEIAGRRIRSIPPAELIQLRNYYAALVYKASLSQAGSRSHQRVVRFVRS